MRDTLFLLVMLFTVVSCSGQPQVDNESGNGTLDDMPKGAPLTAEQEALALTLYDDYIALSTAVTSEEDSSRNSGVGEDIRNLVGENCDIIKTESQSGSLETVTYTAQNAPEKACPLEYQSSQAMNVQRTGERSASAQGNISTKFDVTGADLAGLTPIDEYSSAGRISMAITLTSETGVKYVLNMKQAGTITYNNTTLETVTRMIVNMQRENDQFTNGILKVGLGAKTPFGWIVIKQEQTYVNGVLTQKCYLNGKDISGIPQCDHASGRWTKVTRVLQANVPN